MLYLLCTFFTVPYRKVKGELTLGGRKILTKKLTNFLHVNKIITSKLTTKNCLSYLIFQGFGLVRIVIDLCGHRKKPHKGQWISLFFDYFFFWNHTFKETIYKYPIPSKEQGLAKSRYSLLFIYFFSSRRLKW